MADIKVDLLGEDAVAKAMTVIAGFRDQAKSSQDSAVASANAATTAYNGIIQALAVGALSGPYLTKAAADAAAASGTIPAGAYILVATDSTQKGATTIRQRVGSASTTTFTFALNSVSDGFSTTIPVVASNNFQQPMLKAPGPMSGFIGTDGVNDSVEGVVQISGGRFTNGWSGHTNYFNSVVGIGVNSTTAWTPLNPALPSASFRIESKFAIGSAFFTEFHASTFSKDNPSTEFRMFSGIVPHNEADWAALSRTGLRGGVIDFVDGSGVQRFQISNITNVVNIDDLAFAFADNNVPIIKQINATADALLSLPYFNNKNNLVVNGAILGFGGISDMPELGEKAFLGLNCTTGQANGSMFLMVPSFNITGNLWGIRFFSLSVSGIFYATEFANNHASGSIVDRRFAYGDMLTHLQSYNSGYFDWEYGAIASNNTWMLRNAGTQVCLEVDGPTGVLNLPRGKLKIGGTQVLSTRQAAIGDIAGGANVATVLAKVNDILAMLRAHGLIATA